MSQNFSLFIPLRLWRIPRDGLTQLLSLLNLPGTLCIIGAGSFPQRLDRNSKKRSHRYIIADNKFLNLQISHLPPLAILKIPMCQIPFVIAWASSSHWYFPWRPLWIFAYHHSASSLSYLQMTGKKVILLIINCLTFKIITYHRSDTPLDLVHQRAKIVALTKAAHPASN